MLRMRRLGIQTDWMEEMRASGMAKVWALVLGVYLPLALCFRIAYGATHGITWLYGRIVHHGGW